MTWEIVPGDEMFDTHMTDPQLGTLTEALLAALAESGYRLVHPWADGGVHDLAPAILAHLPQSQAERDGETVREALDATGLVLIHRRQGHGVTVTSLPNPPAMADIQVAMAALGGRDD